MVKLENAESLIKLQIFIASTLLVIGLFISCITTTSNLMDCNGAGADILLLVDVAHPGWHEMMQLYSKALMHRFDVARSEQLCRFKKVEYESSPMEAVDMEFLGADGGSGGVSPPQQPNLKFLIIFTASEEVLTAATEDTVAKVASLNVTTIVAAFDYAHKVPFEDLEDIVSDSVYLFVANRMHANLLIDNIVNVVCREVREGVLHSNGRDATYDCGDNNPCSVKVLRGDVLTFPYKQPGKFVACEDVDQCVIEECIYGYTWNKASRTCR